MHGWICVLFLLFLQNAFQNRQFFHFSKEKTEAHVLPQYRKQLKEFYAGSWGNTIWKCSSVILLFCTNLYKKTSVVAWCHRRVGRVAAREKQKKEAVSFFQRALECQLKEPLYFHFAQFLWFPFPLLAPSFSWFSHFIFLTLPPNKWSEKMKRDGKISKPFSCFLCFANVAIRPSCLIRFCFYFVSNHKPLKVLGNAILSIWYSASFRDIVMSIKLYY